MKRNMILSYLFFFIITVSTVATAFSDPSHNEDEWKKQQVRLVKGLESKGITDKAVLQAMTDVPRHAFVPKWWRSDSYQDRPLPIGHEQTISQPYIVAYMCEALKLTGKEKVLEIGTGSGYHAAVLSLLSKMVYTIEIVHELGESAAKLLDNLEYENIEVKVGDGYQGWAKHAPFDAIILTAAPPKIPQPLLDQLKIGGRLIAPVGVNWQELVLVERVEEGYKKTELLPVRFVPMTGEAQQRR
ncbi:MAG: protein-L-isoaspartate(D-aspartate) O-methyltransferase [Candidatus Hatepunaea meridiana]|nr:protein-L-isoaspartate(D-aspartate) O-methyltransferase [Candidatus Hatepunaea meridiana]